MFDFATADMAPQAILVTEELLLAERHEAARADDSVVDRDRIDAEIQVAVTLGALWGLAFLLFHGAARIEANKNLQPICALARRPSVVTPPGLRSARTEQWLQHNKVY